MRLTKVRVTKLFGLFDHEIPLNREARITIIHGPNGFGKTILLRMIAELFSERYEIFREVPFEKFSVEFDGGNCLSVEPTDRTPTQHQSERRIDLHISLSFPDVPAPITWSLFDKGHPAGVLASAKREPLSKMLPGSPKVRLVRTQRLETEEYDEHEDESTIRPTVAAYSDDIVLQIRRTLSAYANRSQELDRTFPVRLLGQAKAEPLSAEELRKRMGELEQKRSMLMRLGFLNPEQELSQAPVHVIEAKRDVLSVYVEDVESKLAVFDEMASKVQLFARIVNERFLFKRLEIRREQGFVFTSETGARLKPTDLSSGEQHELILLYELLFQLKKNALVLLDEPEVSLHVAWQEKFLGDLMEVVKLSEIDVVIATHSPEIIGEHWDLTVELKGPSELRKS